MEENIQTKENEVGNNVEEKTPVKKVKRRFVGRKKANLGGDSSSMVPKNNNSKGVKYSIMPIEFMENEELNEMIKRLPNNYNFEIHKTLWRIKQLSSSTNLSSPEKEEEKESKFRVALQFPEGLLMYSCIISDILEYFGGVETLIMGDVTYGACCVDDLSARALGCDLLVHYGHSCLVPIDICSTHVLYVFVDIKFDLDHFIETVKFNFEPGTKIILTSTIQFAASLGLARGILQPIYPQLSVPQAKPLSPGEILGCTSPKVKDQDFDAIVYLGDGRFHLESIMISNPNLKAYRYDPYSKVFSKEYYEFEEMYSLRKTAIATAAKGKRFGLILGTLGRQGSPAILKRLEQVFSEKNKEYIVLLLSEISPGKLNLFESIDAWIQIACPRLSIDWGNAFDKPLLNTYEAFVALGESEWKDIYPMDFYAREGGKWSVYYQ